jgi:hypothetical protein
MNGSYMAILPLSEPSHALPFIILHPSNTPAAQSLVSRKKKIDGIDPIEGARRCT